MRRGIRVRGIEAASDDGVGNGAAEEENETGVGEAGGLIGRKLSARAILRRIRDSPGSYPSRPLLDSSDVHRLPACPQGFSTHRECFSRWDACESVCYVFDRVASMIRPRYSRRRRRRRKIHLCNKLYYWRALTPIIVFSSVMVTCLALSSAEAT